MLNDATLIAAIRRGERAAFATLVELYQRPLLALAFQFTGRREDAEDLVQETFIAAYRDLPTLQDAEKLRGWLAAILRHLGLRQRQRISRRREEPLDDHAETLVSAAASEDTAVFETMQRLAAADREVLVLRYLNELSFREIGNVLGISVHAAEVRCARARERLWKAVRRDEEEEATRRLVRQALGAVVAGGLSVAATERVMAAVTPLMSAPPPPTPPLLNPVTLQPVAAVLKAVVVKTLVGLGVAGVLVTGAVLLPRPQLKLPEPPVSTISAPLRNPPPPKPQAQPPVPVAKPRATVRTPAPVPRAQPLPPVVKPHAAVRKPVALPPAKTTPPVPPPVTAAARQAGLTIIGPVALLVPVEEVDQAALDAVNIRLITAIRPQLAAALKARRGETLALLDTAAQQPFMQELRLDRAALANPAHWPALAERTGATYLLLSELAGDGNGYSFDARLVDLTTHHDVAAASLVGTEMPGE